MKICIKCGREIIPGINGCTMLSDCFDCRGGYPDYSRNKSNFRFTNVDWDELDAAENRCLRDCED